MADQRMNICLQKLFALSTEQDVLTYGRSEQEYLPNPEQEMLSYGRSEHECLPNVEQHMLIAEN